MKADQETTTTSSNTFQLDERPPLERFLGGKIHELSLDDDIVRTKATDVVENTNANVFSVKEQSEYPSSSVSSFSAFDDSCRIKAEITKNEEIPSSPFLNEDDNDGDNYSRMKRMNLASMSIQEESGDEQSDENKEDQEQMDTGKTANAVVKLPRQDSKRRFIDYEKSRQDNYEITLPQSHVSTEFKATKKSYGMPTCYTLDKRLEEIFSGVKSNDDNKVEMEGEQEKEERIEFMFKVKRNKIGRRKSMTDVKPRYSMELISKQCLRENRSDDFIISRKAGLINTKHTGVINAMMKKSKRRSNGEDSITAVSRTTEEPAAAIIPFIPLSVEVPERKKKKKKSKKKVDTISKLRTAMLVGAFAKKLKNRIDASSSSSSICKNDDDSDSSVAQESDHPEEDMSNQNISPVIPSKEPISMMKKRKNDTAVMFMTTVLAAKFVKKLRLKIDSSPTASKPDAPYTIDEDSSSSEEDDIPDEKISKRKKDGFRNSHTGIVAAKFASKLRARIDSQCTPPKQENAGKCRVKDKNEDSLSSSPLDASLKESSSLSVDDIPGKELSKSSRKWKKDGFNNLRTAVIAAKFANKLKSRVDSSSALLKEEKREKDNDGDPSFSSPSSNDPVELSCSSDADDIFETEPSTSSRKGLENLRTAAIAVKFASKLRFRIDSSSALSKEDNKEKDNNEEPSSSDVFPEVSKKEQRRDSYSKLRTAVIAVKLANKLKSKSNSKSRPQKEKINGEHKKDYSSYHTEVCREKKDVSIDRHDNKQANTLERTHTSEHTLICSQYFDVNKSDFSVCAGEQEHRIARKLSERDADGMLRKTALVAKFAKKFRRKLDCRSTAEIRNIKSTE